MKDVNRREAMRWLGAISAAGWMAAQSAAVRALAGKDEAPPALAAGSPKSPERVALIEEFRQRSESVVKSFEARSYKSDWVMPYRLFRPSSASGRVPLVVYSHGSGGLGDDNLKQMGLGNIFGTRVWALPENQKKFPCYVAVPQTDRGWSRYAPPAPGENSAKPIAGLGDGCRVAMEMVDALCREFAIDQNRIYVTGQSMGGGGSWNAITYRPKFFAAAVICCGSISLDDGTGSIETPVWNFHGDSDQTVPVGASRDRIAARRKAGGHPIYTEYVGVDHNVWEWAYTEPGLLPWVFGQRRHGG